MLKFLLLLIPLYLSSSTIALPSELQRLRGELKKKPDLTSLRSHEILNVSYDPTREFYSDYNLLFKNWWKDLTGQEAFIIQSHGGSAKQARSVISGLETDVISLALSFDIDVIEKRTDLVGSRWRTRLPNHSIPYYSTIVFLVRKGNPKNIRNWEDLIQQNMQVITPNPKTSGAAKWTYLAAWSWAYEHFGHDVNLTREYIQSLYARVPVLDTGARGAANTFIQRKIGDVLLTWENEAYLAIGKHPADEYEIIYPSSSILAEPPVTWLEKVVEKKGTRILAISYLKYLYSIPAQLLIAGHGYRPYDPNILRLYAHRFPQIRMTSIEDFGGWDAVQEIHFDNGGAFDQLYANPH